MNVCFRALLFTRYEYVNVHGPAFTPTTLDPDTLQNRRDADDTTTPLDDRLTGTIPTKAAIWVKLIDPLTLTSGRVVVVVSGVVSGGWVSSGATVGAAVTGGAGVDGGDTTVVATVVATVVGAVVLGAAVVEVVVTAGAFVVDVVADGGVVTDDSVMATEKRSTYACPGIIPSL